MSDDVDLTDNGQTFLVEDKNAKAAMHLLAIISKKIFEGMILTNWSLFRIGGSAFELTMRWNPDSMPIEAIDDNGNWYKFDKHKQTSLEDIDSLRRLVIPQKKDCVAK